MRKVFIYLLLASCSLFAQNTHVGPTVATSLNNALISPLAFGAKCDGSTDDTAAFTKAIAFAGNGGTIVVPASASGCKFASSLTVSASSIIIQGTGWSYGAAQAPSTLKFAAGVNGLLLSGNAITIRDLAVVSADSGANSDIGIHFTGGRPFAEHVLVQGFGGAGFEWDSSGSLNVDHWYAADLRALSNFGDGFLFVGGTDTNAGTAINLDASLNGGIGFNLSTSGVNTNTFIGTVAATNTGGDYNIAGSTSSNYFLNAYCESGTGSSFTIGASSTFNQVIFPNFGLCATITNNGGQSNQIYYQYGSEPGTSQLFLNPPPGTAAGAGQTYEFSSGIFNPKDFALRDVTGTTNLLDYNHSLLGGSWHFLSQAYFTNFTGATSAGSTNSGISGWFASCWNGSTAQNEYFTQQLIGGSGTNGTETLTFTHHNGCTGPTSYSFDNPLAVTITTGTAPLAITSTTPVANLTVSNHPQMEDCGATSTCAKTKETAALVIRGSVAFPTASTVVVSSLPFTSSSSYSCTAGDVTTAAGVINATTYTSGASVTFTETGGTNADVIRYVCIGF